MSDVAYLKSLLGVQLVVQLLLIFILSNVFSPNSVLTIRDSPDFPRKGINFLDVFPILRGEAFLLPLGRFRVATTIPALLESHKKIDIVAGLDARGFLLGPTIAMRLNCGFVPIRKKGKLPGKVLGAEYVKEYGTDVFEIQVDSIKPGQLVIIVDDLIATGGTSKAAGELVEKLGGKVIEYLFIIEAVFLKGPEQLNAPTYAILKE